jgi:hypothetical protein
METDPRLFWAAVSGKFGSAEVRVKSKLLPSTFPGKVTGGPWLHAFVATLTPLMLKHQSLRDAIVDALAP